MQRSFRVTPVLHANAAHLEDIMPVDRVVAVKLPPSSAIPFIPTVLLDSHSDLNLLYFSPAASSCEFCKAQGATFTPFFHSLSCTERAIGNLAL